MDPWSIERILVPVDGSPCSEAALDEGIRLALELEATVTVLHVLLIEMSIYTMPESKVYEPALIEEARGAARAVLGAAVARAERAGVTAEEALVEDARNAVEGILQQAEGHDLTVMATHGRRGAARLFLGSVAEGVLRRIEGPVLLVRCP